VSSSLRVVVDAVLDAIGRDQLPVTVSGTTWRAPSRTPTRTYRPRILASTGVMRR
jgi:hypothetical protein